MPTRLRHRHRLGHGPCSTHLLTLGLTPIAALPLGACDPAHEGQLSTEPTGVFTRTDPSAWSSQWRVMVTGRSSSTARPSLRVKGAVVMGSGYPAAIGPRGGSAPRDASCL